MKSTADFKMFFLEGTELFFPDILFDTAFLINFICRPRMMTWLRENWRLCHIRCEIRSEINGIGNFASYWVSSWDSWLLLSYLTWILRIFLVAKIVRLVMQSKSAPATCQPNMKQNIESHNKCTLQARMNINESQKLCNNWKPSDSPMNGLPKKIHCISGDRNNRRQQTWRDLRSSNLKHF